MDSTHSSVSGYFSTTQEAGFETDSTSSALAIATSTVESIGETTADYLGHNDRGSFLQKDPEHAFIYLTALFTALTFGTFGNIMIVGAHARYKKLRKTGNEVIINLALADLCVTAVADPMCVIGVFKGPAYFDDKPIWCEIIASLCLTACFSAFFSLGFLTITQYLFVCHSNTYYNMFNKRRVVGVCVAIWVGAFAMEFPNFVGWGDHYFDEKNHQCIWDRTASVSYTMFVSLAAILCPLFFMSIAYMHMFYTIHSTKKNVLKFAAESMTAKELFIKEWRETMRACRTLMVVVVAFIVCWVPYAVVIALDTKDQFPIWVHLWVTYLAHLHSVVNFWIYGITNKDYRDGYLIFLGLRTEASIRQSAYYTNSTSVSGKTTKSNKPVYTPSDSEKKVIQSIGEYSSVGENGENIDENDKSTAEVKCTTKIEGNRIIMESVVNGVKVGSNGLADGLVRQFYGNGQQVFTNAMIGAEENEKGSEIDIKKY